MLLTENRKWKDRKTKEIPHPFLLRNSWLFFFSVRDGIWVKGTCYILYLGFYNFHQCVKTAIFKLSNSICFWVLRDSLYLNDFRGKEGNICRSTLFLLYFLNKYNTPQQFTQQVMFTGIQGLFLAFLHLRCQPLLQGPDQRS